MMIVACVDLPFSARAHSCLVCAARATAGGQAFRENMISVPLSFAPLADDADGGDFKNCPANWFGCWSSVSELRPRTSQCRRRPQDQSRDQQIEIDLDAHK